MDEQEKKQFLEIVKETIKVTVNGKIDNLTNNFNRHAIEDKKWKEAVNTKLDNLSPVSDGVTMFKKVKDWTIWWSGFFGAISVILGGIGTCVYFIHDIFFK